MDNESIILGVFWEFLYKTFVCMTFRYHTYLQNMLPSLPDPQPLRNQKSINPILRNCNLKDARFYHFCLILMKNTKNQAKILQSCFLQIAISQDWVDGFQISQRLWVRKTCEHILKLSWFHNSCKHNFYVIKTPKTHLRLYSHSAVTVCTCERIKP